MSLPPRPLIAQLRAQAEDAVKLVRRVETATLPEGVDRDALALEAKAGALAYLCALARMNGQPTPLEQAG